MHFIPNTGTHKHTPGCAEPVKPVQIVPRSSIHDLICLFFLYSCLYFQCLSFEILIPLLPLSLPLCARSYQTQVILLSALQWHKEKDMEHCHETKARERKHFSLQDPAEVHYLEAGASTGVWGQDTNECLSVRVWRRHVGILSDYRAVVVSLAMLRESKRSIAPLNQLKMLARSSWRAFVVIFAWLRNMWGSPRHRTPHDWLQLDAASSVKDNSTEQIRCVIESIPFAVHSSTQT